jgi:integrase
LQIGVAMNTAGDGTVYYDRAKGAWFAKIPVGRTKSGATAYRKRTALNRRDAERVRRQLLQEREEFRVPSSHEQSKVTFQAFATQHLDGEARQEIREVTRRGYLYLLERFAFPRFGEIALQEITSTELSAFLLELRKVHSASLVNQLRAAMSRVFSAALSHQLVSDNPIRRTKPMRRQEGDRTLCQQPWSLDECREAMKVAVGSEMDLFVHLAILTGARLGEMMGLQWGDIDLTARTLIIRRSLVELRGSRGEVGVKSAPTFSPPKTAKSVRTLTFGQSLADALERHKIAQEALRSEAGETWVETDQVFTTAKGSPVWVSNFSAKFRRFLKVSGLRTVNVHSIRHSFAVNGLTLGIDLPSISKALGHASLQITLDVYAREKTDLQDRATKGLADGLNKQ